GLLPTSSILTVRGSSVTNDFLGQAIVGLDRADIVGKNVMNRRDPSYGAFVHKEIVAALHEPSLSEIEGTVYRRPLHYERLSGTASNNQVLSVSRVIKESSA